MDNILKLLLGVLGVAGLIAFATSSFTVEAPAPVAPPPVVVVAGPPPGAVVQESQPSDMSQEEPSQFQGEDNFVMGQPSIDGKPYGSSNQSSSDYSSQSAQPPVQADANGYAMPSTGAPQVYSPQPPPGTFIPVNNAQ